MIYPEPGTFSTVPYAEPAWLMKGKGFTSPYFKQSHHDLAKAMRLFVDTVLAPEAQELGSLSFHFDWSLSFLDFPI